MGSGHLAARCQIYDLLRGGMAVSEPTMQNIDRLNVAVREGPLLTSRRSEMGAARGVFSEVNPFLGDYTGAHSRKINKSHEILSHHGPLRSERQLFPEILCQK